MIAKYPSVSPIPCAILALADSEFASLVSRNLQQQGWEVFLAPKGSEARQLAQLLDASVLIIDDQQEGESCWLTSAKLKLIAQRPRIVLITTQVRERELHMARFVGADALIPQQGGLTSLLRAIAGSSESLPEFQAV